MFEMRYAAQLYNVYCYIHECVCANANVFIVLEHPDHVPACVRMYV